MVKNYPEIMKTIRALENQDAKKCNVLSFDGGGSRGLMEAMIIDDIMKMATLMKNCPEDVERIVSQDLSLSQDETLRQLKKCLVDHFDTDETTDGNEALHPTDVFDYIAGN